MVEKQYCVIAFESTHHAIQIENLLKKNFKIETIPTPREISASCGLSIKFSLDLFPQIKKFLNIEQKEFKIFKVEKVGNIKNVTKLVE